MVAQVKTWGLTLIAAAALAACGGGGGGTTSTTGSSGLTGSVIDGAIEGADVCLDLNNSLSCDSGEPTAKTKANGSYTLDTAGLTAAQIKNAHIFVTVPTTAKDADDGGKTLAEAGKAAFNLMAPAESAVASDGSATGSVVVVSPMTTLVSHEMMLNGTGTETAKGLVKNKLGLASNVDITQNFVGKTDSTSQDLAKKAQFLAATLGEVMKTIATTSTATTSTKTQMLGALDYLKTNAQAVITAATSATSQTPLVAVQTALQTQALQPVVNTLVKNAEDAVNSSPVIGAATTDFASIIKEGFYSGYCSSESSSASIATSGTAVICNKWHLYSTKSVADGQWESTKYYIQSTETAFTKAVPKPEYAEYTLVDGAGWVSLNINPRTGTYAVDSTGLITGTRKISDTKSSTFKTRMVAKEVGGKTLGELGSSGNLKEILNFAPSLKDTQLPAGSKLFVGRDEYAEDEYWLGYNPVQNFNCSSQPCTPTPLTSFSELLAMYATPSGAPTPSGGSVYWFWTGSSNGNNSDGPWYAGTFDAEGRTDAGGNMTVWKQSKESNYNWTKVEGEKSTYTIKTVAGEKILLINLSATPLALRVQNTGTAIRQEQIFAVRDGKLYNGSYASAQARTEDQSRGNWNKTAAEAIIKAMGATKLPQ